MRVLIINLIVYVFIGGFLISQEMYATTWKFWVFMIAMVIIHLNNSIQH